MRLICAIMQKSAAEAVRRHAAERRNTVTVTGCENFRRCRPHQAAERTDGMERPNEAIYCLNFWRNKFHGKSGDEPYFDVVEGGFQSGKKMRVYVDARRFPTWSEWKTEADKARACAYVGESTLHGYFIKSGTAYPLSAAPPFMIEAAPASYLDPILWINVPCPSESEFHWAVAEAKNAAELKSKKLGPSELYAPFCNVQYPHKEVPESELEAFLRTNGIETARAAAGGVSGEKTYGPLPEDIKKLLRENGLDASECGDTLGELFQRWGIE